MSANDTVQIWYGLGGTASWIGQELDAKYGVPNRVSSAHYMGYNAEVLILGRYAKKARAALRQMLGAPVSA